MGSIISTSKCVSSYRFKMMLYLLILVPLAWGGTLPGSPDILLGPGGHYEHPIDPDYYSQNEVYKIKDKDDCHPVERTVSRTNACHTSRRHATPSRSNSARTYTRRRLSRTGPACSASTLSVASTRIRMARELSSVRRCPRRSAMTLQER